MTIIISGCASYYKMGDGENVWISEQFGGLSETLYYCSNKKLESGKSVAICEEARFIDPIIKQKAKND